MAFAYCPDCAARIYVGRKPWLGQAVLCDDCDADLEVITLNPLELAWVDELALTDGDDIQEVELETLQIPSPG